jgi:hypothetical protein
MPGPRKTLKKAEEMIASLQAELERTQIVRDEYRVAFERAENGSRPNFGTFVEALRDEADWIETIKAPPNDGHDQARSDAAELRRLADRVEIVGKRQGYM